MHHVLTADRIRVTSEYVGHSERFGRCVLVDRSAGSVHMGVGLCALESGGRVDTHLHSFEESFYILEGQPTLVLDGRAYTLLPGACGLIPVGVPHGWRGAREQTAKWIDMCAPQPRTDGIPADTFFTGQATDVTAGTLDIRDPRSRHLFRMVDDDILVDKLKGGSRVDAPAVSASMNTALLAYSGIALKMLVDQRLDAQLHTMFMVEYQPGGAAHFHDHPLEESYYIIHGEVEAWGDGQKYVLKAGDLVWTGVGCIHAFFNRSNSTVRWLETQSPQLPGRHGYRFNRDWEYLEQQLTKG
jgi:quercetin dioxygenase-like cupin family protein